MTNQSFSHLPIFHGLTEQQLNRLSPLLDIQEISRGQVIFEQNQSARFVYILIKGEVTIVYKPEDGPAWTVTRILPGGVFGWSAAMGHTCYTSSAIALTDCQAFCITGKGLETIFKQDPETGLLFLENLASGIAVRMNSTRMYVLEILTEKWLHSRVVKER